MQISVKLVSEDPTDNLSSLVQAMTWCQTCDKPSPKMSQFMNLYMYMRHQA